MGRGKGNGVMIKKMSVSSQEDTEELNKMFSQMTGTQDADTDIVRPKIINIYKTVIKFQRLFKLLVEFDDFANLFKEYSWSDEIKEFIISLNKSLNITIDNSNVFDFDKLENELLVLSNVDINNKYKTMKENTYLRSIIISGNTLSSYKKYIENLDELDYKFVKREPGLSLQPFEFTKFDLKLIWEQEFITDQLKKYILTILHHAYNIGISLYDILTSPDIDIKKFSQILVENIAKMRKQIPRCDKAFDVIENSVKLLEDNFKSYYKSSVEAENPSIIVENFIIDISSSQKASPIVTSQFRRIVSFLKTKTSGNTDPKIKKLFSMLNTQFSAVDKELGVKTDTAEPVVETGESSK